MIGEAEIRRLARQWGVDPMLVDLDYVLGCFLASLYRREWAKNLVFKGGTCLRKCYYPGYRFSEGLDLTAVHRLDAQELKERVMEVIRIAEEVWQIDFSVRPIRVDILEDEYGKETYQARIYYRGRCGAPAIPAPSEWTSRWMKRLPFNLPGERSFIPIPMWS